MIKVGDKFKIDWDALIRVQHTGADRRRQEQAKKRYGEDFVYRVLNVLKADDGKVLSVEFTYPDQEVYDSILIKFVQPVDAKVWHHSVKMIKAVKGKAEHGSDETVLYYEGMPTVFSLLTRDFSHDPLVNHYGIEGAGEKQLKLTVTLEEV